MRTEWCASALEHYSAMNQNRITPLTAAWMDRVITLLSKVSQRDKYHRVITERYILEMNANFRYYTIETDTNLEKSLLL